MRQLKHFSISVGFSMLLACADNSITSVEETTTVNHAIDSLLPDAKEDIAAKDTTTTDEKTHPALLSIDSFKNLPGEIEGCACYFSDGEDKLKENEYLFVSNYDSVAFMSIDKELVRLKMVSTTREPESFGDNDHIDIYRNDKYKVSLDIKYKKSSGEETWQNSGTITIDSKDGQRIVKKFFGECGC